MQIDFWGGYASDVARCQRTVSRAAAGCAARAAAVRTACLTARLEGESCDEAATDAAVEVIRAAALDRVERDCTDNQLRLLEFAGTADALNDVITVCRDAENAAASAAFAPARIGGTVAGGDPDDVRCVAATARATTQLLRAAIRVRRRTLDAIAAEELEPAEKYARLDRAAAQTERARSLLTMRLRRSCPDTVFATLYPQGVGPYLAAVAAQADCFADTAYAQSTMRCPVPQCGNGMQERNEECDDGNDYDGDTCRTNCTPNQCDQFVNTFDLIQHAIFERRGCTDSACHGNPVTPAGGLDLRTGVSYENLIDVESQASEHVRVFPGDQLQSFLWLKLAAKTYPRTYSVPLSPMPIGQPALTPDELKAVGNWIHDGAPRTGTVPDTGERLDGCLPPPEPIAIRPPAPPPPGEGVQLHMPRLLLPGKSEQEVCYASYYDFTDQVPAQYLSADGARLRFNRVETTQNPLSHHMVVLPYTGNLNAYPPDHSAWGAYRCAGGEREGEPCDPVALGACGDGAECASEPRVAPGCVGYGPPDAIPAVGGFGFAGAQENVVLITYADGVYGEVPVKGVVVWNSHAYNLTRKTGVVEGWVNLYFATPDAQRHQAIDAVDISAIFSMEVPAFEQRELCAIYTLPENAHLFELTSHTHRHGKRFRVFRGAFTCFGGPRNREPCSPFDREWCQPGVCHEPRGLFGNQALLYTSLVYSDPVALRYDPPMVLTGFDRSLTYCSLYDNGATDPSQVKRQSTSPEPALAIGGPCATPSHCMSGQLYAPCTGGSKDERDRSCDTGPDARDGLCDACTLRGGITTEDEMFVLIGRYYVP